MLTEEQKIMLTMSDDDIKNGRVLDQESLNEEELKWLRKNNLDQYRSQATKKYSTILG